MVRGGASGGTGHHALSGSISHSTGWSQWRGPFLRLALTVVSSIRRLSRATVRCILFFVPVV